LELKKITYKELYRGNYHYLVTYTGRWTEDNGKLQTLMIGKMVRIKEIGHVEGKE